MQNTPAMGKVTSSIPGTSPTFLIKVVYAENFSIQGYIRWIEEGKSVPFRSYMELLHLIEEGLYISKSEMTRLRSWDLEKEDLKGGVKQSEVL
ncbi:MAG TPA: hypothetical protein PKN88_08705 [Bacillota bacterium]|jgi:hypothetical protein|nr:hypothetical protein [Bacillota bacterium]HQA48543.1 hypothetical protein [Bacillota bacterium]